MKNDTMTRRLRRRRNVIDLLAQARPQVLGARPRPPAGWPDAAELIAAVELADPAGGRGGYVGRPETGCGLVPRHRLWAAMLSAAATAAVIALVLAGASGLVTPRPRHTSHAQVRMTARAALLAAAAHVPRAPAVGKYWRLRQVTGTVTAGGTDAHPYDITTRFLQDEGLPPVKGRREWSITQSLGTVPWTAADDAQWVAAGSPSQWITSRGTLATRTFPPRRLWQAGNGIMGWVEGELPWWTDRQFQALPASPTSLRRVLLHLAVTFIAEAGPGSLLTRDSLIWQGATQLLQDPVTWQVRVASLRVMAGFAGLRSLGWMRDPLGRRGIGIYAGAASGLGTAPTSWPQIVVIDPADGALLAVESVATPSGLTPGPIPSGSLYHGRPCLGGRPMLQPLGPLPIVPRHHRLICLPVYFHRQYPMQVEFWQAVLSAGWTGSAPKVPGLVAG